MYTFKDFGGLSSSKYEILLKDSLLANKLLYMGDFTQLQQKYAGTGENHNIAIPAILYPVIKPL